MQLRASILGLLAAHVYMHNVSLHVYKNIYTKYRILAQITYCHHNLCKATIYCHLAACVCVFFFVKHIGSLCYCCSILGPSCALHMSTLIILNFEYNMVT